MGFRNGSYAKIWRFEDKGNYSVVEISTSKKNRQSGEYETDFSTKFCRFIGTAHEELKGIAEKTTIKLGEVEVTNSYNKETKQSYTNFLVFSFELTEQKPQQEQSNQADKDWMNIPGDSEDPAPFK